jgi:hypothetical protein
MLALQVANVGWETRGQVIARLVGMAARLDMPVQSEFNGIPLLAMPEDSDDQVEARYRDALSRDERHREAMERARRWWQWR